MSRFPSARRVAKLQYRRRVLVALIGLSLLMLVGTAVQSGAGLRVLVMMIFIVTVSVATASIAADLRRAWRTMRERGA